MMITKPSKVKKLSNFPNKALPFFNGYKFDNKYFSVDYRQALAALHNEHPKSKGKEIFALKMQVFSKEFSKDLFSRDVIRVHESVLRIIQVNLSMLPVGFHLYFDVKERCIKSTFFLLNFNKMSDEPSLVGTLDHKLTSTLHSKIRERVCSHYTFTFTKKDVSHNVAEEPKESGSSVENGDTTSSELDLAVFELVSLFGDQEYKKAMDRAFRGLPLSKALKFSSAINALIELNGDESIEKLKLPSKGKKSTETKEVTHTDKRLSENLLQSLGLYEL
ncbi:hypothetical protein QX249_09085 [Vibrio parahaemolyticus]|uniref:Uncharacterized protein n=1 Tax=Vibrio parahaemolyticus TaxID=670 RepID=A0AAW8PXY2_VIBPH|nr:hypothetical protein [Vibrio parahaemolyticus]EGR2229410.1 hypothetical protein [Vibrio parahaemolyticus]MDS1820807.1 hypothetical protein [Vibrio parahaemolyticus]